MGAAASADTNPVILPCDDVLCAIGQEKEITLHDGSVIRLHKSGYNYDPYDKENALHHISQHKKPGKIATGLLYINQSAS